MIWMGLLPFLDVNSGFVHPPNQGTIRGQVLNFDVLFSVLLLIIGRKDLVSVLKWKWASTIGP